MTEQEAIKWVADLFEEPVDNLNPETARSQIRVWDSLGVLNLLAGFDEEFGILLSEDEVSSLRKVGDILDTLKKHGRLE